MTQPVFPDFGHDLACLTDEDAAQSEVSGLVNLAHALVRRLQTPLGTLIGDPNYGYDIIGEIDDDVSTGDIALICANVDREFPKDERVTSSTTTGVFTAGVLILTSTVYTAGGPSFSLVMSISTIVQILKGPTL